MLAAFRAACRQHGIPASTLTDNGMVFTTWFAGGKGGRNHLETWLRAQPHQPATLTELQALLDTFTALYNTRRPHRSLPHRATPATAYTARPKATPGDRSTASTPTASSPCASAAASTTSASAAPMPAPAS